jgi:carbamoyl-phosphate synthase large subunit
MDIYELENSKGVVVSVGGQLAQNVALRLQETGGAKVLGTDPRDIDKAEDRQKFSEILDSIGIDRSIGVLSALPGLFERWARRPS